MKHTNIPVRLLAEILGIVGLSDAVVTQVLPLLVSGLSPLAEGLFDISMMLLLAAPLVYWRTMAITRAVVVVSRTKGQDHVQTSIRAAVAMTGAAQALGLALTVLGVWWWQHSIAAEAQIRFDHALDRVDAEVLRRLEYPVLGLIGVRGAYMASDKVTHAEFRDLVQNIEIDRQFHGVRGFGFIERVQRSALEQFVAAQKADGMKDFQVNTAGQAPDLYVVKHIEPLQTNFDAWGRDFGQDPARREVLERAVASGEASLSSRLTFVDGTAGLLYVVPVYRRGTDPSTPQQRRAALAGLVFAPLVASDVMQGAPGVAQEAVTVEFFDGDVRDNNNLLYKAENQLAALNRPESLRTDEGPMFQATRVLNIGGRFLNLRVTSTPAFDASLDRSGAALMALSGAFGSFMLALAVWLLASGRVRAQNLARRMTAELDTMARVVQTTDNAVVITDAQLRITWANDGFSRMSGYTLPEALGKTPGELLGSGKSDPEVVARLMAAGAVGEPCRVELINRRKDGHEYWIDTDVHPMRDEKGGLVGFMEVGTDITAQKQAQLDLLAAQQHMTELTDRLNLAIEGGNDGLWDWMDLATDAQWWSPSYYNLIGYTPQELPAAASNYVSLVHPDQLEGVQEAARLAIHHGKPYDQEMLLHTKHQGYRWFRSRAKVFRDAHGNAIRMAGSAQDIHDRKQAEAEVRQAEALLRGSIDALDDAYVLYDPQDRLVLCNQRHREMYPVVADLLVPGNSFEFIIRSALQRGQYPDAKGREDEWVAQRLAQHRLPQSNFQQVLKDGRILRVSERRMEDGYTVGFRVDITDFIRATQMAEEASRAKSQFLANMSHEIRTPMNAILGMLRLLQNTELSDSQKDYAGKTEGAARSLLGLLNDILDFSKVEAGKMTLDPRPFQMDKLLRDLSVILSSNVGAKDVEVLFDVDPGLPRKLVGDDMRLQQVLINLGGNAIKFTSRGEVVLRLRLIEKTDSDMLIEFAVKDSGIGIAPENQTHIFSGFSQAEASTTRRYGGTGLGLAISSRLVKLMGGDMRLQSTPGQGSEFSFQIRLGLAAVDADAGAVPPQTLGQRTLVVDDNDIARDLLAGMTRTLGWKTQTAASGAQAVQLVQQSLAAGQPFEAIFIDWQMPEMDGWQTLQRIGEATKSAPGQPAPLLMMVTAHGREMLAERKAHEAAALDGFLVKPVTASMLLDAVMNSKSTAMGSKNVPPPRAAKPKRLLGMRLLVVEDNKINQAVAQGLLSQEGAIVTLADNGRLGVDAVLDMQPAYDAVLMDLQMPVMDGFEATRSIRKDLRLTQLPIIAMTANAMASDREACLAAGMNDHVGKPFELDHLVATLQRHTRFTGAEAMPLAVTAAVDAPILLSAQEHEHAPGDLDLRGALDRVGGDENMYATVLGAFAKEMDQVPHQVLAHLRAQEHAQAVRALHTLKGLAATVGARHLAAVAARLEHKVRAGAQAHEHADLVATLRSAIEALGDVLLPVLQRYQEAQQVTFPADTTAVLDRSQLQRDLQALVTLLRNSDMVALNVHTLVQQTFGPQLQQELVPLKEAMASLDFPAAAAACEALIERHCV
ncbi:MAG: CHASE domain-containing protein [Burkholderiales bacterium]|nr:CHASE domain-containing protein [Burkholderiales bacterium]